MQSILFTENNGWDGAVSITQDEKYCLIGCKDNRISIHQVNDGKAVHIIENVEQLVGYPRRITLSPSGDICLIIRSTIDSSNHLSDSIVRFIATFHNEILYESNQQKGIVWFSSFSDNENICITSDLQNSYIWDIELKRLVQRLSPPKIVERQFALISRPPFFMVDSSGEVEIYKIPQNNQYRKIAVIYNYNSLKVKNCRFTNIITPNSIRQALSQHCAET